MRVPMSGRTGRSAKTRIGSARMRIATWNINSIRTRIDQVVAWSTERAVDVVLLQETKCGDNDFPFEAFTEAGYDVAGRYWWPLERERCLAKAKEKHIAAEAVLRRAVDKQSDLVWRAFVVDTPLNETLHRCFCYGQATRALARALTQP